MSTPAPGAARAAGYGMFAIVRSPGLLIGVLLLTIVSVIPFALTVQSEVLESLAMHPGAANVGGSEVDPEWWLEFRRHATGMAATFTPAVLGFAAPLDSFSALLDGSRRPLALIGPVVVSALLWAFIWGGAINRFARDERSLRAFVAAGARHFTPLALITVIAAVVSLLLYVTIHPLLLGFLYDAIAPHVSSEPVAFLVRVLLYVMFGAVLVLANALFAFARIEIVANGAGSLTAAIAHSWRFIRSHARPTAALYLLFILLLIAASAAYGVGELYGGSRVGGWRAVVIGQAFIGLRLALRLALSAAQVRLAAR